MILHKKTLPTWFWPIVFFVGALALRLVGNTYSPPNLYWEEVALGYDAYSILKTGRDHHGSSYPLVAFPSFGDFKPSLYFYVLVPSVAFFGLTAEAVRLPAAIFSAATVAVLFVLIRKWSSERLAFWSGLLLMFQPWSWQVGRVGFETNLATFLLVLGVWVLDECFTHQRSLSSRVVIGTLAASIFSLSMYAYHGARLLAPLFAGAVFLFHQPWKSKSLKNEIIIWILSFFVAMILLFPLIRSLRSLEIQQRFRETSIFSSLEPIERSNQFREFAGNSVPARLFFHRSLFYGQEVLQSYISHFSPQFLFGRGDANPRHTSQYFGALYPWEIVTLILGMTFFTRFFPQKRPARSIFLALIFLSPLAAAFTTATPHALRTLPLSVWLSVVSAMGICVLLDAINGWKKWGHMWSALVFLFIVGSFGVLSTYYFSYYRVEYASQWQYGYEEAIEIAQQLAEPEEQIFVSREYGRPAMYTWFYTQTDPRRVQSAENQARKDQQEFLEFENWQYHDGENLSPGLHVAPRKPSIDVTSLKTIIDLNGQPIFEIYRVR